MQVPTQNTHEKGKKKETVDAYVFCQLSEKKKSKNNKNHEGI